MEHSNQHSNTNPFANDRLEYEPEFIAIFIGRWYIDTYTLTRLSIEKN